MSMIGNGRLNKLLRREQQPTVVQLLWTADVEDRKQAFELQLIKEEMEEEWRELNQLLEKYEVVFTKTKQLPLERLQDH